MTVSGDQRGKQASRLNFEARNMRFPHGGRDIKCTLPKRAKYVSDGINTALAERYAFTPEETNFIINHGIKYRMAQDGEE
ncbi:MAG: hypothetical protein M3Z66_24955 [Chloroflexota bacterium]|nr:hypothetical protein [Chloroflexota bacterium]